MSYLLTGMAITLLSACVSPNHFSKAQTSLPSNQSEPVTLGDPTLSQTNSLEQNSSLKQKNNPQATNSNKIQTASLLPAIELQVFSGIKKNKPVCVSINQQPEYINCFENKDLTDKKITELLESMALFSKIAPVDFTTKAGAKTNPAKTPVLRLFLRYQGGITEPKTSKNKKVLLQLLTLFMAPMNYQVKHQLQATLYQDNKQVWQQAFTRETIEWISWYNIENYKMAAVKAMLSEMAQTLRQFHGSEREL